AEARSDQRPGADPVRLPPHPVHRPPAGDADEVRRRQGGGPRGVLRAAARVAGRPTPPGRQDHHHPDQVTPADLELRSPRVDRPWAFPHSRRRGTDMRTVGLLVLSNTFMTVAWYGHLKYKAAPLLATILVS